MPPASAVHSPEASYLKLLLISRLPAQLGGQLHVELLARSQARRAVEVSDGVVDLAEPVHARAVVSYEILPAREVHRSNARREVNPVEHVEHIRSKLQRQPLFNRNVFDDREIEVPEIGSEELIARNRRSSAAGVALAAESARVDPLDTGKRRVETMRHPAEWTSNQIQAGKRLVVRLTGVKVQDRTHLPIVNQALGPARSGPASFGQIIGEVDGEQMSGVKIAVAIVGRPVKRVV